jgi:regulation of enolase protein 1 (concanavalin A-like superfamily)
MANGADTLTLYFRGNPIGFVERAPGVITMSGSGTDIWNSADQFRFAFQQLSGNGSIIAKVESVDNTDPWAKGGVMIRESLDPGARFAAVYATPGNGVRYQARLLAANAATSDTAVVTTEQTALKTPVWIKIERTGNSFSCFYSAEGVKWTSMSWNPQTIALSANVYLGLVVTSHNAAATATAQFSNVSTTGAVTGSWQTQAIGVAQPTNDPAPLYVVVQDGAGKSKRVTHPDPAATTLATWQPWHIGLSEFSSAGVKMTGVKKMVIGVGDRANPKPDGAGLLFLDDIGVGHPAATNP